MITGDCKDARLEGALTDVMASSHATPETGLSETKVDRVIDDFDRFAAGACQLQAGIYHHPAWKAVLDVYGLRTYWLSAERAGRIVGLLPLALQSSRLFGRRLTSLPWTDEAGAIGDQQAIASLLTNATQLADELGGDVALLTKQPVDCEPLEGLSNWSINSNGKVLMRRKLPLSSEALWTNLSAKVRNQIRNAEKQNVTTERGGAELIEDFFHVYSRNMRDLGSPSHSLAFFRALLQGMSDRAAIYCSRVDGEAVGAGFVLTNGRSLDIPWASSLRKFSGRCVNHAMYWRILSDACDAQYEWFHFGRSTVGSGQYRFKKQWGADEAPLNWLGYMRGPEPTPSDRPGALREKFRLAERAWAKLPLCVSRRLGPHIIRHVP